jgi:hypothetical protein
MQDEVVISAIVIFNDFTLKLVILNIHVFLYQFKFRVESIVLIRDGEETLHCFILAQNFFN